MRKFFCLFLLGLPCFFSVAFSSDHDQDLDNSGTEEESLRWLLTPLDPDQASDNNRTEEERSRKIPKPEYSMPKWGADLETGYVYDPCDDIPNLPTCPDSAPKPSKPPELPEPDQPSR